MRLSLGLPSPNLAAAWRGLPVTQRIVTSSVGSGAAVFLGGVTTGIHGSVAAQAIAYTGVMGLLASAPAAGAGRLAASAASRSAAAKVQAGSIDALEAETLVKANRARAMAPAKVLFIGGGAVAAGVVAGNLAYGKAQTAVLEHMAEQHAQSRPAIKNQTEAG